MIKTFLLPLLGHLVDTGGCEAGCERVVEEVCKNPGVAAEVVGWLITTACARGEGGVECAEWHVTRARARAKRKEKSQNRNGSGKTEEEGVPGRIERIRRFCVKVLGGLEVESDEVCCFILFCFYFIYFYVV